MGEGEGKGAPAEAPKSDKPLDAGRDAGKEYRVLIETIVAVGNRSRIPFSKTFGLRAKPDPIQGTPFKLAFRVTNRGTSIFPGATISDISVDSMEISGFHWHQHGRFAVKQLNPGESTEIAMPQPVTTPMQGLAWANFAISAPNPADTIVTLQRDPTGEEDEFTRNNAWGYTIYLQGRNELRTARTNFLLLLLTIITTVDAIWGMGSVVDAIVNAIANLFDNLAEGLRSLS